MLRGSSLGRAPRRPSPFCGWRKLCLLTLCRPLSELSRVKASGVSEARRSKEEEEEVGRARVDANGSTLGRLSTFSSLLSSSTELPVSTVKAAVSGNAGAGVTGGENPRVLSTQPGSGKIRGAAEDDAGGSAASKEGTEGATSNPRPLGGGSAPPGRGRILSLAMVAWMELMGTSPPKTRSWGSCWRYTWKEKVGG